MDTLLQDVRYAARRLGRSRGFTLIAALTLALGIGANSAIFGVINAVLLRPLPFPAPERLDRVFTTRDGIGNVPTSPPDFLQMQAETRSYDALAAYTRSYPTLTGEGDPVRLTGLASSASLFEVLGVEPRLGRVFTAGENEPGSHRVAVLGHALWQQRYGGDPAVLGRAIRINGEPFEVIGVMPAGFDFPAEGEIWIPLEYTDGFHDDGMRASHFLSLVGRRRAGVSTAGAAAEVAAIAGRIERAFPALKTGFGGTAVSLRDEMVGDIRTPLLVLLGAVGLVLLIACVNIANLLLARAAAREAELAVRSALGAERGRLVRQLLTESLLLGLIGGALGLLVGAWGTDWLLGLQPEGIPRLDQVSLDWTVVGFTGALSVFTGLLFGIVPAYQATRGDLIDSLKEGARGGMAGRSASRMRGALVVAETALAVILLSGAGLLMRSFAQLSGVDPGFRTENALAVDLSLPGSSYPDDERLLAFHEQLVERLRGLPGVTAVGTSNSLPMSGFLQMLTFRVDGRPDPRPGEEETLEVRTVSADYLPALGVPVLRGRGFTAADRDGSPPALLLNETAANRYFPGEDPLGRRITLGTRRAGEPVAGEVIGIVGDVKSTELGGAFTPGVYLASAQFPDRQLSVVLRTATDPTTLLPAVRQEIAALDANLPLFNTRTLEELVGRTVSQPRFYMVLLAVFAATALVLAAIGIFGVMSYTVVQRSREIGIRVALGADAASVLRLVVGGALTLSTIGVAIGIAGALASSRLLEGLLYGVSPSDPLTLAMVAVGLTAVAMVASYLPARRAARADPMVAIRAE